MASDAAVYLAGLVPLLLAVGAGLVPTRRPLEHAVRITGSTLVLVALLVASRALGAFPLTSWLVRVDTVTCVVLALVSSLGFVLARYGRTYLATEPGLRRYARAFLAALAGAATVAVSENLVILLAAWTATSVALHALLTFYDRPAARTAAHKKRVVSRMGDLCLVGGGATLAAAAHSTQLSRIVAWASSEPLPGHVEAAVVLFVVGACLKTAQLPFHGWLIQVMEAPTPVSALLHAGVVNLAGIVLIRFAPVTQNVLAAQAVLVAVGTTSAVVAALVMASRISVKVRLAWSTCAQMGFMLVECGLGLHHLALLHLVAHSLYKAHAFLTSGSAVEAGRPWFVRGPRPVVRVTHAAAALAVAPLAVFAGFVAPLGHEDLRSVVPLACLLGCGLVPVLAQGFAEGRVTAVVAVVATTATALVSAMLHALSARLLAPHETPAHPALWAIVFGGFALLAVARRMHLHDRDGRLRRAVFAGFWLDDVFTRLLFAVWPPRHRPREPRTRAVTGAVAEVRA